MTLGSDLIGPIICYSDWSLLYLGFSQSSVKNAVRFGLRRLRVSVTIPALSFRIVESVKVTFASTGVQVTVFRDLFLYCEYLWGYTIV